MKFTIPGDPKPQGRPRFFRRGNFVGSYDPLDSRNFKQKVASYFRESGGQLMDHPIRMVIKFYMKRPKNLMRKKDPEGIMACAKRPDFDNLAKAVCDALNGLAFRDDGQIYSCLVEKWYHEKAGAQRTEVELI